MRQREERPKCLKERHELYISLQSGEGKEQWGQARQAESKIIRR
jgi:hypothetical protein